jgi:hypothetical protein
MNLALSSQLFKISRHPTSSPPISKLRNKMSLIVGNDLNLMQKDNLMDSSPPDIYHHVQTPNLCPNNQPFTHATYPMRRQFHIIRPPHSVPSSESTTPARRTSTMKKQFRNDTNFGKQIEFCCTSLTSWNQKGLK